MRKLLWYAYFPMLVLLQQNTINWMVNNQHKFLCHCPEGLKSEISVPAWLGSGENSLLGCRSPASFCGFPWWLRWENIHLQSRRPGVIPWLGRPPTSLCILTWPERVKELSRISFVRALIPFVGLPKCHSSKEPTRQCRRHRRCGFNPWVRKIPWRREW